MAHEASKSRERLKRYFNGKIIDIGSGPDPITPDCRAWDIANGDGDAQLMAGVLDESFDTVFSAHCLEHMRNPLEALLNWWRILKPGGFLLVVMPDEDLYEQHIVPSIFNDDHKVGLTPHKDVSWHPASLNVLDLIKHLYKHKLHSITIQDANYHYDLPHAIDQSRADDVEVSVELVLQKQLDSEGRRLSKFKEYAYCPNCRGYMRIEGIDEVAGLTLRCISCGTCGRYWPDVLRQPKPEGCQSEPATT